MERISWYKDWQLGAAVVAAPLAWLFLYLIDRPIFSTEWLLETPGALLLLILARPIMEEIIFRGLIQTWCIKQSWGRKKVVGISVANLSTSLLFTTLHVISHTQLLAASVFLPSLVFGYFRDRYNGLLIPSIGLHCFYNTGFFLLYQPLL